MKVFYPNFELHSMQGGWKILATGINVFKDVTCASCSQKFEADYGTTVFLSIKRNK